jgi:hypothetical protein
MAELQLGKQVHHAPAYDVEEVGSGDAGEDAALEA